MIKELMEMKSELEILCDLDGVLVDFVAGVNKMFNELKIGGNYSEAKYESDKDYRSLMWKSIHQYQKRHGDVFWLNLPKMSDSDDLIAVIKKYPYQILTATGTPTYNAGEQKKKWVCKHVSCAVKVNLVRKAVDKADFAKPNRILIDDKQKAIDPFVEAGGIGILHTSTASTIAQLRELKI